MGVREMEIADIRHLESVLVGSGDALLVVDMQNDFLPGGALAVAKGETLVPGINRAMDLFAGRRLPIVFTQDWHPPGHHSFASAQAGQEVFAPFAAPGLGPVLWPDHCVQGTAGADFHPELESRRAQAIIRKGYAPHRDSYSGFVENDHRTETGLDGYLRGREVIRIFICGLALDYCVFFTAADGADKGYEVFVLSDLTLPVSAPADSVDHALTALTARGVHFVRSTRLQPVSD